MKTMRAIVARSPGGPDSLVLEERPVPEPHQGEVRIRVAYSPLNPLDTHARADRIKWSHPGFPFTTGYEYAGRVDAVGPGVDDSLVGTRVAVRGNWGGNADYAVAPETQLVDIPECFSWQLGSVFSTTAPTAWRRSTTHPCAAPGLSPSSASSPPFAHETMAMTASNTSDERRLRRFCRRRPRAGAVT